jgi:hypothetical protein
MSGYPDENRPAFRQATHWLRLQGYAVISPDELDESHPVSDKSWAGYMRRDIPYAVNAEIAFALPGWRLSRGATLEACLMHELGVPVFELAPVGMKRGWPVYDALPILPQNLPAPAYPPCKGGHNDGASPR